ncbi:MAG: 1-acyl-sn-glycerol-3-phosphate acyltransferase [Bacteroidota bacterium]
MLGAGGIKAEYYGALAVAVGNANRIKKDITLTVTIALFVLLIFISLFFKRKSIFFIILLPVLFGGIISLAFLFFLKTKVSVIALGAGSVILGITIDYSLHVFTHFRSKGSVKTIIKDLTVPITMSCLTTASAFLCLVFVSSEALRDLGLFAAISIIAAAMFSLIVLPHLLRSKNDNCSTHESTSHLQGLHQKAKLLWGGWGGIIDRITSYSFEKNRFLIIVIIIISIVCAFILANTGIEFESDMMKINYVSEELQKAEQNLMKISSSPYRSVYLVSSGKDLDEALVNNEKTINKLEELKNKDIVKKYSSVSSLLLSDSLQKRRIQLWEKYWTDEKKQLLKKRLIDKGKEYKFKETAFNGFYNLLNKDFKPLEINKFDKIKDIFLDDYIVQSNDLTSVVTLLKVKKEDREKIYLSFSENDDIIIFDKQFITEKYIDILKSDFNLLVKLSLFLVLFILIFSYGRIELGLITFIPMLLGWLWTLGIMELIGLKFNIFNIIISTFIFGLGIDYSIFIMRGLLQEYKYGYKNLSSYKTAIFLSAFTTITGIGVLIFAKHPALRSIALLSIIGILSVVIISYTIEPVLFRWLMYKGGKRRTVPVTFFIIIYSSVFYPYFFMASLMTKFLEMTIIRIMPLPEKKRKLLFHKLIMYVTRSTIYIMFLVRKKIIKPPSENFKKPAVIICNHQSLIDIPLVLMFTPKLILLTNDWVWNSPYIGGFVKLADFYPASSGIDKILDNLSERVKEGYSILVFPEGTRSVTTKIKRFHKGAFYLAEKLKLDILPMVIHGTGHYVTKGEIFGKKSRITVKFLDRIRPVDTEYGAGYSERTKTIARYFKNEFEKVKDEYKTTDYYKDRLIKNFIYKGPILEWYLKVKLMLENNYKLFNELIPGNADIVDVGCGYGFLAYMLSFVSEDRKITGIDYDSEKIRIAENCFSKNQNINFICSNITKDPLKKSDVFILCDVLHYLPRQQQEQLIVKCIENLNKVGTIIIRDADKDLKKKHWGTKYTEFFSTNFGFNKTTNKLEYMSRNDIFEIVSKYNINVEVIDDTRFTSNIIYVIRN